MPVSSIMGCGKSTSLLIRNRTPIPSNERHACSFLEVKAAILIQKWYRKTLAKLETRRRIVWNIFQEIEYYGEQNQNKLHGFFNMLLREFSDIENGHPSLTKKILQIQNRLSYVGEKAPEFQEEEDPSEVQIEIKDNYDGPRLTFPLDVNQLHSLINAFKDEKILHVQYLINLLKVTMTVLQKHGNFNAVSTSILHKVTICGDIHGKLDDLLMIFNKNSIPSQVNSYVFNGDFIDRGSKSVEVAAIIFSCLILFPNNLFLNRGNHEDRAINFRYGFLREIMSKYKVHTTIVMRLFDNVFKWIPIGTIIDDKILVVHGGISNSIDLNTMANIQRQKYTSIIRPWSKNAIKEHKAEYNEWSQLRDLLWSDPMNGDGCVYNVDRGAGKYFGPEVTNDFLNRHRLELVIRSHECKAEGYEYTHNGKVLTIFSASNYYALGSNKGAYGVVEGINRKINFVQFVSNAEAFKNMKVFHRVSDMERSALKSLKKMIFGNQTQLLKRFKQADPTNSGCISIKDWCIILSEVLNIALPWRHVQPMLTKIDKKKMKVIYETTFGEETTFVDQEQLNMHDILYQHKDTLSTIFRVMDKDNSGSITMEEFQESILILMENTAFSINKDEILDLAKSLDINKDGMIDINEFFEAFRISSKIPT